MRRKDESQQQNSSHGALECTAFTACRCISAAASREEILHVVLSSIYADLFQQVLRVSMCFLFGFVCCFFLPVQINTLLQVWKDKKSHTASPPAPETLGNAPHCGPTSWPRLAEVWLVVCWTAAVGVLDAFFIRGWGGEGCCCCLLFF